MESTTVKELKEVLSHFNDDDIVKIWVNETIDEVQAGVNVADEGEELLFTYEFK